MALATPALDGVQSVLGQLSLFMAGEPFHLRAETNRLKLSLKLYHGSELQVGYQQLVTEVPQISIHQC